MKIVFFGLGSIGRKHMGILLKDCKYELYAFRSSKLGEKPPPGVKEIFTWKEFYQLKPDVVFITNPTSLHIKTAFRCARNNCKLFIEKPLGNNKKGLAELINLIRRKKLVTYVAYNLRFHPAIKKLKEYLNKYHFLHLQAVCTSYLPNWRPKRDFKKSYSAQKDLGGGALLDLSHEIDYISYLLGNITNVNGHFSRRSNLTIDTEDYADILVDTDSGPANIHVDFFSHVKQRVIRIDFREMTIIADLINGKVEEFKNERPVRRYYLPDDKNISYINQIGYFLENIDNPRMMNNVFESREVFAKIMEFKEKHD